MNMYWLIFISMSVVGSLTYNVCFKLVPSNTNVFLFSAVVGLVVFLGQLVAAGIATYGLKADMGGLNRQALLLACGAGLGAALIDVGFFLALRYGSLIASQTFWTIGGTAALTIFSILVFKEMVTPVRACGILLGIVSLFLLTRQAGAGN